MTLSVFLSRLALVMSTIALLLRLVAPLPARRTKPGRRKTVMAFATLALGIAIFALFFGLVAACDRL